MITERVSIKAGIAVIRYVATQGRTPDARIALRDPGRSCEILFDPRCAGGEMTRPGHLAVVRAERDCVLDMEIESTSGSRTPRGSVQVEYLSRLREGAVAEWPAPRRSAGFAPSDLESFGWRAHVAYRGDISGEQETWICGPNAENRIEAVAFDWPDCPSGLALRVETPGAPRAAELGEMIGTKRRSNPLRGLDLALEGEVPEGLVLEAEAMFARRRSVEARGRTVRLRGQDGSDELVGLRVRLALEQPGRSSGRETGAEEMPRSTASDRVRIFRA